MGRSRDIPVRIAYGCVALAAAVGIALHYIIVLAYGDALTIRTIRFFSFFTILTNGLVAFAALGRVSARAARYDRLALSSPRAAVTLYIIVVALIYHLLLGDLLLPGRIGWWANFLVHKAVPLGWTLCWFAFGPHGGIDATAPWRWLLFPFAFACWTLVHGAATGWYPYPFFDVTALGYPAVLRNIGLIGALFLALGCGLKWIDGRLSV